MSPRRSLIFGAFLAVAPSVLVGCSWVEFKETVYDGLRQSACREQQRTARPDQRGAGPNSGCFPQSDPRTMTAAQYDSERKRVLAKQNSSGATAQQPASAEEISAVDPPEEPRSTLQ